MTRYISLDVSLISIRDISTVHQSFEAVFTLYLEWRDDDTKTTWDPKPYFLNSIGNVAIIDRACRHERRFDYTIHTTRVIVSGKFSETFELEQFPMDIQRLTIGVILLNCPVAAAVYRRMTNSENAAPGYTLYPRHAYMTASNVETNTWSIIEPLTMCTQTAIIATADTVISRHSFLNRFDVSVVLERHPEPYFWSFVFPIFILLCMSMAVVFIEAERLKSKIQILSGVYMTVFAVKFVSTTFVPTVACVTYLDAFFNTSIAWNLVIYIQVVIVFFMDRVDVYDYQFWNAITMAVLMVGWVTVNTFFASLLISRKQRRRFLEARVDGNISSRTQRIFREVHPNIIVAT